MSRIDWTRPRRTRLAAVAALGALLLLASSARAQFGGGDVPDYVLLKTFLDRDGYQPGDTARLIVEFKIDPSVHINSDKPVEDFYVATSLTWTETAGVKPSAVTWPKAARKAFEFTDGEKIPVFEGTQRASLTLAIPASAPAGDLVLEGVFRAQGCTHTTCYAPQNDDVKLTVRVVAAGATTSAINTDRFGASAAASATSTPAAPPAGGVAAPSPGTVAADPTGDVGAPSTGGVGAPSTGDVGAPSTGDVPADSTAPASTPESGSAPSNGDDHTDDVSASAGLVGEAPGAGAPGGVPAPHREDLAAQCPTVVIAESQDRPLALVFLLAFVGGIALAFTPCVLPLVPITIGFFSRQQTAGRRPVVPALLYVLGLAIVYSTLGTIAALSGGLFGSLLQKPVVIVAIALVLFALALSMFGLWDMNLPPSIANRIGGSRTGNLGAMAMGGAMGLVAAPCVGPLLVSLLTYVAEIGSRLPSSQAALLGGSLFFALSLGLGLPFFLVALGSASLRPGEWMVSVKKVFGFIILGVVLWFLRPVTGPLIFKWGLVLLLLAAAIYFLTHASSPAHGPRARVAIRAVGALALVATIGWTGYVLKSLGAGGVQAHAFGEYSDDRLERARADGRAAVVDFSAEWCIACKELETRTFTDGRVQEKLKSFVSLRADLTDDNAQTQAIYKKWRIRGLPTIIFLDSEGKEIPALRLTGFEGPLPFVDRLDCALAVDIAAR